MGRLAEFARAVSHESRPGRFLLARLLAKSGLCRFLQIRCEGYRMVFFPTAMSSALWVNGDDRREDVSFFRAYLRPGDCVLDVGANVGFLTLLASSLVGPHGRVFALEAHPRTAEFLRKNLALNGFRNVEITETAVGAAAGEARFTNSALDDQNYVATGASGGIVVPMLTLDDLFAPHARTVDLLKIDVEGYELEALRGGAVVLSRTACVYLESSDAHYRRFGTSPSEVIELLEHAGFTVFHRAGNRLESIGSAHSSPAHENLVASRSPAVLADRLAAGGIQVEGW